VSVSITQWGVSPFPETAGGKSALFKAIPAASDVAAAALSSAAAGINVKGAKKRFLQTGVSGNSSGGGGSGGDSAATLAALVTATGGQSVIEAATAALLARFPRASRVSDLLPDKPLDSRVMDVGVSLRATGGAVDPAGMLTLSPPLRVTVPLRDLSIVAWDSNGSDSAAGVNIGTKAFAQASVAVVCPTSPKATQADAQWTSGGGGAAAAVRVEAVVASAFSAVVGSELESAPVSDGASSLVDTGKVATDALRVESEEAGNGTTRISAAAPVVRRSGLAFVLSVDCGAALGRRGFVCGVGAEKVEYTCPAVVAVPTCLFWEKSKGAWSGDVCAVAAVGATSIDCDCTRLGAVAVRYAALEAVQVDVFGSLQTVTTSRTYGIWFAAMALVGVFVGLHCAGAIAGGGGRSSREEDMRRFAQALDLDEEMMAASRAAAAAGQPWRLAAPQLSASKPRAVAAVAPLPADAIALPPPTLAVSRNADTRALYLRARAALRCSAVGLASGAPQERLLAALAAWRRARAAASGSEPLADPAAGADAGAGADADAGAAALGRQGAPPASLVLRVAALRVWASPPALLLGCARRVRAPPASAASAPRSLRLMAALTHGFAGAAATAALYANAFASAEAAARPQLPALPPGAVVLLALAAACVLTLLDAAVAAALRCVNACEARVAAPGAAWHAARAAAAAASLRRLSTRALLELALPRAARALGAADASALALDGDDAAPSLASLAASPDAQRAAPGAPLPARAAPAWAPSAALGASLSLALLASLCYAVIFLLARGGAAAAGVIGAWALATLASALVLRPLCEVALVGAAFLAARGGGAAGAADAAAVAGWAAVVAVPCAAACADARGALPADVAVAAFAPLRLLAAAWTAGAADRLRWAALSAAAQALLAGRPDGAREAAAARAGFVHAPASRRLGDEESSTAENLVAARGAWAARAKFQRARAADDEDAASDARSDALSADEVAAPAPAFPLEGTSAIGLNLHPVAALGPPRRSDAGIINGPSAASQRGSGLLRAAGMHATGFLPPPPRRAQPHEAYRSARE
jgi:hypothetical protein